MYLKIPKDCLVRQYDETAFGYGGVFRPNVEHFVFSLRGAEYDGYTFTVTSDFGRFDAVKKLGNWYSVYVSSDDLPIVVKRTENREDGKRYKQYKFTPAERVRKGDRRAVQRRRLCSLGVAVLSVVPFRFGGRLIAARSAALVIIKRPSKCQTVFLLLSSARQSAKQFSCKINVSLL